MNILITGAKGMVGTALVNNLKNIRDGKNRTRPGIHIDNLYCYDLDSTPEQLDAYCTDCDFVFNLAGVNRPQNNEEFMQGNFGFASTLLDTLKKHNNRSPIMLSSSIQATLIGRYRATRVWSIRWCGGNIDVSTQQSYYQHGYGQTKWPCPCMAAPSKDTASIIISTACFAYYTVVSNRQKLLHSTYGNNGENAVTKRRKKVFAIRKKLLELFLGIRGAIPRNEKIGNRVKKSKDAVWSIMIEEWCKQCAESENISHFLEKVRLRLRSAENIH